MSRSQAVLKNTIWELGCYIVVLLLGFLAPRYIILVYGSEVNGLSSTITQILNTIFILQSGATTAAVFSLYKPIADNDMDAVSKNIASAEHFYRKFSLLFLAIMIVAAFVTSELLNSEIDSVFILPSFIILGLKTFFDLAFTAKYRIIFTAFQEKFFISIATLIEQVVYYLLVFLTIYTRIHFIFLYLWLLIGCLIKVLFLSKIYKKHFSNKVPVYSGKEYDEISGRTYSFANEISHSVVSTSITIILSFMYGLKETSVYSVYALVISALNLISTAIQSAFAPSFGNLMASGNKQRAKEIFEIFQYLFVMINTFLCMCMLSLIVPFVKIYTSGAEDINYVNIFLAGLLALDGIFSSYRIPYNVIVSTGGFFKETWLQPVICCIVSVLISVGFGAIDYSMVLIGPTVFHFINFVYQHYKLKSLVPFLIQDNIFKVFFVSLTGIVLSFIFVVLVELPVSITWWILEAIIVSFTCCVTLIIMSILFEKEKMFNALRYLKVLWERKFSV